MPSSILEDSENLNRGGKSTLKLLFLLGITILIYLSTNLEEVVTWLKNERASEVSSEFIPSKPEELSFLLPTTARPRTTSEKKEREEKILRDMNSWMQQVLSIDKPPESPESPKSPESVKKDKELTNQLLSDLKKTKDPKILIKATMKVGNIHPREFEGIANEAIYFNLYLDNNNQWRTGNQENTTETTEGTPKENPVENGGINQ